MQTNKAFLVSALAIFTLGNTSCQKEKDENQGNDQTKTQLIVAATWKLQKAETPLLGDFTSQLEACVVDNTLTFTSTAENTGTGILDEGTVKCDASDPQSAPFTWQITDNGTTLTSSAPLFPAGSTVFKLVTLNATNLVVSQDIAYPPYPSQTVTFTLKH